jgi:hypothetical protein
LLSHQIRLEEGALLPVKGPAAARLDLVDGTEEDGGAEILKKEGAEALIPREIAAKVVNPSAGRDNGSREVGRASTNLAAASAEVTPAAVGRPLPR